MNSIERTTKDRNRKAWKVTWWKIFLAGAIMMPAALYLRGVLPLEVSLVAFLAGAVCCIAGVIVGIVKGIRARIRASRSEPQVLIPAVPVSEEDEEKTKRRRKILLWIGSIAVMPVLTIVTREGNFLVMGTLILISGFISILISRIKKQFADVVKESSSEHPELVIDKVILLGSYTTFKRGGTRGALLGCLLGGGIGAVLGTVLRCGPAVHWQQFAVKYTNGRTGTEEHAVGSRRYNELMQYVDPEDF